jgi:Uma2 family endonuclease
MSTVRKLKLTEAEYLAQENASEFRSEFYDGEVFLMTGASVKHNRIKENLTIRIGSQLWGKSCQSFSSDQRVKVQETGFIAYPDIVVVCGELKLDNTDTFAIVNPQVIIEILSPTTQGRDRVFKLREYRRIPSLKEYLLISQTEAVIEHFAKIAPDDWRHQLYLGRDGELAFTSLPIAIARADIFAGVDIPDRLENPNAPDSPT